MDEDGQLGRAELGHVEETLNAHDRTIKSKPIGQRDRNLSTTGRTSKDIDFLWNNVPISPFDGSKSHIEETCLEPENLDDMVNPFFEGAALTDPHNPTHIIRTVNTSPTHPIPQSPKLSTAIKALEDIVHEAALTAMGTADVTKRKEVYCTIEGVKFLIQPASEDVPKPITTHNETTTAQSESKSAVVMVATAADEQTRDPRTSFSSNQQDVHNGLEAIDWAYTKTTSGKRSSLPAHVQDSDSNEEVSPLETASDPLLVPQPIQTASRNHVDFVLRPAVVRVGSDGPSYQHSTSRMSRDEAHNRLRHRRSWRGSSQHTKSNSDRSPTDTSYDEEEIDSTGRPLGIKRYKTSLTSPDQGGPYVFSRHRDHRRHPIARSWRTGKKRLIAMTACINTAIVGIIIGIYAGEVPRIQYVLADEGHTVIMGNVVLYAGLAISTFVTWPLPLLHGRKPYILGSLALTMPLQFPQALVVGQSRSPSITYFRTGLLVSRAFSGLVLGFANVNFIAILLDLFGASLQSKYPHQEIWVASDVRRHGGGMGIWLGIWSWCQIGSLPVGFCIGARVIASLPPDWGFYITIMILALSLVLNTMAPETRRSASRKAITEIYDRNEKLITLRIAKGEIKLHMSTEGPKYWFEEVWAGMKLSMMMLCQTGFAILSLYLAWIYGQIVLVIVLLGSLLSRDYRWQPQFVGLGVLSMAIGALFAVPLSKAGIFSRDRKKGFRTDSMTFEREVTWTSHLIRRCVFTIMLPLMGIAYTVSSRGASQPYQVPIVFAGAVGFLSTLAIAECHGLIMETFDTCDLQPGVNTKHRLQSMADQDRRRRTNYTSFPRVSAGIFVTQTLSFILAAIATQVGGVMTRRIGAQASTGVFAGILLLLTLLLSLILVRFRRVQVIPNHTFGTKRDSAAWREFGESSSGKAPDWRAVVIGNPSGKMRRMNVLELGELSRWTEVRRLNYLIRGNEKKKKREDWF